MTRERRSAGLKRAVVLNQATVDYQAAHLGVMPSMIPNSPGDLKHPWRHRGAGGGHARMYGPVKRPRRR